MSEQVGKSRAFGKTGTTGSAGSTQPEYFSNGRPFSSQRTPEPGLATRKKGACGSTASFRFFRVFLKLRPAKSGENGLNH